MRKTACFVNKLFWVKHKLAFSNTDIYPEQLLWKSTFSMFICCVCSVRDSHIKQVEEQLCIYLTQQLIDNVTFLLPNTYPPKHTTGDCPPSPSPASLSVGAAHRTLLSGFCFSCLSVIWWKTYFRRTFKAGLYNKEEAQTFFVQKNDLQDMT